MGTVIPIDFRQGRHKHTSPTDEVTPGMHGHAVAAICVACLACLQAPLLMLWTLWLPSVHPQAGRCGEGVEES
ncbi:hypothetical protein ABC383_27080 [Noviherbaspirillum sp. 1P10PC]|uniref:hypothetical protein n=1 Tax=Noviherbaspirillum sp. 1P10PC TaxID=3132292 RepID=UPI00399F1252